MKQGFDMNMLSRRALLGAFAVLPFASYAQAQTGPLVEVEKDAGCGCCKAWISHLEDNGFSVNARDVPYEVLSQSKIDAGLKPEHFSCHTAKVDGYVVEGHVPAEDIRRMLAEKPDALGLTVPGMPMGSPGMDFGNEREAYDVLLVKRDGSAEIYSSYTA